LLHPCRETFYLGRLPVCKEQGGAFLFERGCNPLAWRDSLVS
jgi:hypothetical protein